MIKDHNNNLMSMNFYTYKKMISDNSTSNCSSKMEKGNNRYLKGKNIYIFPLIKFTIFTLLIWIVTFINNYGNYMNDRCRMIELSTNRFLAEPLLEFDTVFDVFKDTFLKNMGCNEEETKNIRSTMKLYFDNIDMNALSKEMKENGNFFEQIGNNENTLEKFMKKDISQLKCINVENVEEGDEIPKPYTVEEVDPNNPYKGGIGNIQFNSDFIRRSVFTLRKIGTSPSFLITMTAILLKNDHLKTALLLMLALFLKGVNFALDLKSYNDKFHFIKF
ncbi:Plasmodium exported protein (hyp16), unknown function [Plasmodium sp. gorilla clade G2]|uniref:Plasmodium exported protein (hyp16), unknown function n=1 Tax=Plasmodium sp. gorilla clade G2 TaxID=880535 RepID=UPI000D21A6F2|nr:Plasmodium exported protein (hyp16), unknown function [Plasmodium sp. gorilla clade G2]SOV14542.1 Plasmodium exported protein (hyp16), unknown function [Plasmodium sp. gorilla clade G2]